MELEHTNLGPVVDLARKALGTEVVAVKRDREKGDVPVVVIDKGREIRSAKALVDEFEQTQPTPYRRHGTFHAADLDSLIRWMARECDDDAPIFGEGLEKLGEEWRKPKLALVGIGNYSAGVDNPEWHDFNVRHDFTVALSWNKWAEKHGEWMDQGEFAAFVESRIYDISEPTRGEETGEAVNRFIEAMGGAKIAAAPQKVFELSRGMKIMVSQNVEVQLDRNSGEEKLHFTEEHTGKGDRPLAIPKMFWVRIPVFFGRPPVLLGAILRYRNIGGGKVVWSYELFAPDLVVAAEFESACDFARKAGRTVYLGTADKP